MRKIIGSVLIFLASTGIGMAKATELQQYVKELESLRQLFLMLQSEISYTKATLGEAFLHMARKQNGILKIWLIKLSEALEEKSGMSFSELWNASIVDSFQKSHLKKEDMQELMNLGMQMGYLDENMQLGVINLYLEQLELTIQRTREELLPKKRLYHSLGVMGGIFLIILFF